MCYKTLTPATPSLTPCRRSLRRRLFLSYSRISHILTNPKVHYRVHKSLPLVLIQSHIHSPYILPSYFVKFHFNIILPITLRPSKWPLYWTFSKTVVIHLDLITLITPGGRSKWPRVLRRGSSAARLLGLHVRTPPGHGSLSVVECCVLSGRGLCIEPITRPERSNRVWCV